METQHSRRDKVGKRWNFTIWYEVWTTDANEVLDARREFFWDDDKRTTGVVLFMPGKAIHFSRIRQLVTKLISDPELRKEHRRELSFPLERHYSEYGAFPEEISN